ncbi:MAG TPA: squalene synthase HpnC [Myxococcota bacterium]|nr:squalene synthase HpnC [Myxococcota bacterium]
MHTRSLDLLEANRRELAADVISARADTENFPVALRILSAEQRRHLMAIYRFARLTDQIGDAARGDRLALLDELQRQLDGCADSDPDGIRVADVPAGDGGIPASARARHPVIELLAPTIRACALPIAPFHRLIDANRLDQRKRRCESYRELLDYCALSANPVGELVLHVFGAATPERIRQSDAVCSGLQLVEHWQDVREDYTAGRIYIPGEDLAKFGCRETDLAAGRASPALRELLRFECERAHGLLDEGVPLVRSLRGRARLAIAGFVAGGRAALDAIARASYDVMAGPPRATRRDFARRYVALLLAPARSGARA